MKRSGSATWFAGLMMWGALATRMAAADPSNPPEPPGPDFKQPDAVLFVAEDRSIYKGTHPEAWGVQFRIDEWSRAYTQFDLPTPSKIGRKLVVLSPAGPNGQLRVLVDAGKGVLGSPSVTHDGASVLFSMAAAGDAFFRIYRVPTGGGDPVRLTDGPFHDLDPAELPDGRIVFSSTRIGTFEEYHAAPSRALFVMASDGSAIEPITHTPIFDNEPKVMADGRIAFIRSDNFFGRAKVETQIHAFMPDGTAGQTEFGTDVGADYGKRLRKLGYGSPAPMPCGRMGVISNQGNFIGEPGGESAGFQRLPDGLGDLAPLPDGRLLATLLGESGDRPSRIITVIDPADMRVVIIHESDTTLHSPAFLGPRPRPPVLSGTVRGPHVGKPQATGYLYAQNVRITRKTKADWDQIRAIRVLKSRAMSTRSSHWDFVHQGKEVIELGTVPIAEDGSIFVEVPADVPLALQAVDAEGRSELNEMSWTYVRPGEMRSCVGCHDPRQAAPPTKGGLTQALATPPLRLLGEGDTHRFRGNNSGVSGMMDLQFERFRELASLNRYLDLKPLPVDGREETARWEAQLGDSEASARIAAANRLAMFRDRASAVALHEALADPVREVRVAVVLALSTCGTRDSIPRLVELLDDSDPLLARAAAVALENLTGSDAWKTAADAEDWLRQEALLVSQLADGDRVTRRRAVVALGHIGGNVAREALRGFVERERHHNPYASLNMASRMDDFTFDAASPLNPRTLQAAVRALGHLKDHAAVPLLESILAEHHEPQAANLFLAEAAAEALGWIGTPAAERVLIEAFARLGHYHDYVAWYSDHSALFGCHSSPLHARIIESLNRIGSSAAGPIVPHVIRSVPTDPDRALFLQSDTYEVLVGRLIVRSGRADEVIETCLAILGDPQAQANDEIQEALWHTFNAWAGKPSLENRAAQILSAVCRDRKHAHAVQAAYERYRASAEELPDRALGAEKHFRVNMPQRNWVLFFLGRTLGNLGDPASVGTLLASLTPELNEARHGRPNPADPNVHLLQIEPTPCWRAASAWALGRIGDPRATTTLLDVVANMENAVDTRHAAAGALAGTARREHLEAIASLAETYPEVSTRKALLESLAECEKAIDR
ncbi:MAG: HEAT repeat domain-containing protein [Luteolibacter sp.]